MAQEQRLELRLGQKLILTPQLQQSIKLLQLPLLELSQDINQELMNNPLLEESEVKSDSSDNSGEIFLSCYGIHRDRGGTSGDKPMRCVRCCHVL